MTGGNTLNRPKTLKQCNYSIVQSALLTGFQTDFTSSVNGISVAESQMFLLAKRLRPVAKSEEKRMFSQANMEALQKNLNKLSRVRKAQKKKQQQKSKGLKQGNNQKSVSLSAKKKRLIMKQIKKQQREENAMEVVSEQANKKSQEKSAKATEKMDTS